MISKIFLTENEQTSFVYRTSGWVAKKFRIETTVSRDLSKNQNYNKSASKNSYKKDFVQFPIVNLKWQNYNFKN